MNRRFRPLSAVMGLVGLGTLATLLVACGEPDSVAVAAEGCPVGAEGCIHCRDFAYNVNDRCDEGDLCAVSLPLHERLEACMCATCGDVCGDRCEDLAVDPSKACAACVVDACAGDVDACFADSAP